MEKWERARIDGRPGYYAEDEDAEARPLGPGLQIITPATMHVFRTPTDEFDLVYRVESHGSRIIPSEVTLRAAGETPISATVWRQANVVGVWRESIIHNVLVTPRLTHEVGEDVGRFSFGIRLPDRDLELLRAKGPTDETLSVVGNVYSLARALDIQPVKYLMEFFKGDELEPLPRTTATGWVKKARERGLIAMSDDS